MDNVSASPKISSSDSVEGNSLRRPSGAASSAVTERAIEGLVSTLRGSAILPSDEEYDSARRVYNAMIDRRPRLIVRCADVADVIRWMRRRLTSSVQVEKEEPGGAKIAKKTL